MENPKVWPHQKKAYEELQRTYREVQAGTCTEWRQLIYFCTGAGKTSMLVLAPNALHAKRTLMISPTRKTCDEVVGKMKGARDGTRRSFLKDVGALMGDDQGPKVKELTEAGKELMNHQKMDELKAFDIVVATASKVSNLKPEEGRHKEKKTKMKQGADAAAGVSSPKAKKAKRSEHLPMSEAIASFVKETKRMLEEDKEPLFDALVFDEAHHCPASTWKLILQVLYEDVEWTDPSGFKRKPFVLFLTGSPARIRDTSNFPIDRELTAFTLNEAMQQYELPGGDKVGPFVKDIVFLNVVKPPSARALEGSSTSEDSSASGEDSEEEAKPDELPYQMDCMRVIAHLLTEKRKGSSIPHRALIEVHTHSKCDELCEAINASTSLFVGPGKKMRAVVLKGSMTAEAQDKIMASFRTYNMDEANDVLINDKILGEGFDDPLFSICGVFKRRRTLSPFEQFVGRCVRPNRKGEGITVRDQDQVCHIVTHAHYEQVRIFKMYASQATVDEEDEEDAAQTLVTLALAEGAEGGRKLEDSDAEDFALAIVPRGQAIPRKGVVVNVERYMFNKSKRQDSLVQQENKHYFADAALWHVTDCEISEIE